MIASPRVAPDRLVGRVEEVAHVEAAIAAAGDGRPAVVVVEGEWGAGKSTLLDLARASASERGCLVLSAVATAAERAVPFGVVSQLVEAAGVAPARDDASFRGLIGELAAQRAIVITVDGLEHADEESKRALVQLLARLDGLSIAMVLAASRRHRCGQAAVRAAAARRADARFVRLGPLDLVATADLLRDGGEPDHGVDRPTAEQVHHLTGGNAFLVRACAERLRTGAALHDLTGPALPEVVLHRVGALLQELDHPARALAEVVAAAALAGEPTRSVTADVAPLDVDAFATAVDELVDAGVCTFDLRFAGPLVPAAIRQLTLGSRREELHVALANALWEAGAPTASVVEHLRRSSPGRSAWAVGMLRAAAGEAREVGDHGSAAAVLRRALDEHPLGPVRASVLAELALVEAAKGDAAAFAHVEQACLLLPSPARRAELHYGVGRALLVAGRGRDAARAFERGREQRAGEEWDLLLRAGLVETVRFHADRGAPVAPAHGNLEGAAVVCRSDGARAAMAQRAFEMAGHVEPAATVIAHARLALPAPDEATADDPALLTAAGALVYAGDIGVARAVLDAVLGRLDADGCTSPVAAGLRFRRAQCHVFAGELPAAREDLRAALATDRHGWGQLVPGAQCLLASVLLEQGEVAAAAQVIDDAVAARRDQPSMMCGILHARARTRLAQGRVREALGDHQRAGRLAADVFGWQNPSMLPWRSGAALAAHRIGAVAAARKLVEDELRDARRFGETRSLARAMRVAGLVHGGASGLGYLHEALEVVAASPARLEHAYALADLGGALRRAGLGREALRHLRDAGDLADRLGAAALAGAAADQLRLLGARPRRLRLTGPLALTPGELRVARRAAAGATHRAIAQELFVTAKAVEVHLGNAYRKLGISSRRGLVEALQHEGRLPLPPAEPHASE
jgi:DNA-binding CsgD family transcriptional regulator